MRQLLATACENDISIFAVVIEYEKLLYFNAPCTGQRDLTKSL